MFIINRASVLIRKEHSFYKVFLIILFLWSLILLLGQPLLGESLLGKNVPKNPINQLQFHVIYPYTHIPSKQFLFALKVDIPKGWVLEFINPPTLNLNLNRNLDYDLDHDLDHAKITLGKINPTEYILSGIKVMGYKGNPTFPVLLQLNKTQSIDHVITIRGTLCSKVCVLFEKPLHIMGSIGNPIPTKNKDNIYNLAYGTHLISIANKNKTKTLSPKETQTFLPVVWAFMLAFAIGLLLNVFPCILPALAFKVQHHSHSKRIFSFGVLTSFLLLGMIAGIFKNTFFWGGQFQSPFLLNILGGIFIAFGIISFSKFKIQFLESKFFQTNQIFLGGMLSVFIGVSCSIPLLGSLFILALSFSFITIVALFLTIGVGFIVPYLTVIAPLLQKLFNQYPTLPKKIKYITGILFLVIGIFLLWLGIRSLFDSPNEAKEQIHHIPSYVLKYDKVLVDVTADWCITCKINDAFLKNERNFLATHHIYVMQLDYTKANKDIKAYLKKYHSFALPTFVMYSKICKHGKKINILFLKEKTFKDFC